MSASNGHSNGTSDAHSDASPHNHSNGNVTDVEWTLETYHDTLATRLQVISSTKAFSSFATSLIALPRGALFAPMLGSTPSPKAYSSVQSGPNTHFELNSNLLYCNHSCVPSLEFDVARMEVRVSRERDLKVGDHLTFWYPSSEWEMAQPFECGCRDSGCKGQIWGAGEMNEGFVREYWLNEHILRMLDERTAKDGDGGKRENGVSNGVH
jgi:hypothetical protein